MKTIMIREDYIRQQDWPESLINCLRVVRKENENSYKIVQQGGGYRTIPKDQVVHVADGRDCEDVLIPENVTALLEAAERTYQSTFFKPFFLPGKVFRVVDKQSDTYQDATGADIQEVFYLLEHKGGQHRVPAWCVIPLPIVPIQPHDVDAFVRKFGMEKYREVMKDFSEIVRVRQDGTFITRDHWNGEQRFTVRKRIGRAGKIELLSKFGEFQQMPEVI